MRVRQVTISKIACVLVGLVLGFVPVVLYADLRVTVRPGFDGYYTPGAWTPVHVVVENFPDASKGETVAQDFEGQLMVRASESVEPSVVFLRDVKIPRHSRKHFWLYAKFPSSQLAYNLELSSTREKVLLEQKLELRSLKPNVALVVIASASSDSVYLPTIAEAPYYQTVIVAPGELPDEWYGYDGVGMVLLPRYQTNMFSAEQEKALTSWVESGGALLVLGGMNSGTYRGSFLEPLLPVVIRGSKPMEIREGRLQNAETESSSSTRILVDDILVREGTVIYEAEGMPLAVYHQQGLGRVLYAGIDFHNREILDANVANTIWRAICPTKPLNGEGPDAWKQFSQQVDFGLGGAARLPNVGLIGFVLLFYILLIGPVNFGLLGRKKRLELAWITVPAVAIAFAAGIYLVGYLTKGGNLMVREYNMVRTACNSRYAMVNSLVGLFSPKREAYTITIPERNQTLFELASWEPSAGRGARRPYAGGRPPGAFIASATEGATEVIETESYMRLENKRMEQWTLDFFESQYIRDLGGIIEGSLVWSERSLKGDLVNNTRMDLQKVLLVIGGYGYPLGDFPANGTLHIEVADMASASEGREGFQQVSVLAFRYAQDQTGGASSSRKPLLSSTEELAIQSAVIELMKRGADSGFFSVDCGRVYLIAYSMQSQAGLQLNSRINVGSDHTLFVIEVPVRGATSGFSVPFRCVPLTILSSGDSATRISPDVPLQIMSEKYIVSAQLPFTPDAYAFQDIMVRSRFMAGNNQTLEFSAYNVAKSQWDTLPLTPGTSFKLAPAEEYANTISGKVVFQIASQAPPTTGYVHTTPSTIDTFQVEYTGREASKR